jgi:serine/threonine-protein kinase
MVLEQEPGPNNRLVRGSTVRLVLSSGPDRRTVPELAGKDVPTVTAELEALGLRTGLITEQFSPEPAGLVLASTPGPGEQLRPDTPVALVVSKGLEMLAVPEVVGRPQAEAGESLAEAGFRSSVNEVFSEDVENGVVVAQTPADGQAPRDSVVALDVSKGPEVIIVPDLGGQSREDAEAALEALGLEADVTARPGPGGAVRFQAPGPGTEVRKGSSVTVFVF